MSRPQERIDEALFRPLFDFLANDKPDFIGLEELIRAKGYSKSPYKRKGFILEAYVRWALARFSGKTDVCFSPSKLSVGDVDGKGRLYFITNNRGNVEFRTEKRTITELDGLYEYREKESDYVIPIVLEVKSSGETATRSRTKMKLASSMYGCEAYFCLIRLARANEPMGLHVRRKDTYQRELIIYKPAGLEGLATRLWETSGNKS